MLYPSKLTRDDDSKNQTVFLLPKKQQFSTFFNQIPRESGDKKNVVSRRFFYGYVFFIRFFSNKDFAKFQRF